MRLRRLHTQRRERRHNHPVSVGMRQLAPSLLAGHSPICAVATKTSLSKTGMWKALVVAATLSLIMIRFVEAGPLAYAICQSGCNAMAVACYTAAGVTFGTITAGLAAPAAVLGCNGALGTCMAACVAAGFTPTP